MNHARSHDVAMISRDVTKTTTPIEEQLPRRLKLPPQQKGPSQISMPQNVAKQETKDANKSSEFIFHERIVPKQKARHHKHRCEKTKTSHKNSHPSKTKEKFPPLRKHTYRDRTILSVQLLANTNHGQHNCQLRLPLPCEEIIS